MKTIALTLALLCGSALAMDRAALTEVDAFQSVTKGMCGTLGLGTGLVNGRGWVHQPIPGNVLLKLSGGGTITRHSTMPAVPELTLDMYAGKPYYIEVNAPAGSRLMWKVPGYAWGPVPIGFQLPPSGTPRP